MKKACKECIKAYRLPKETLGGHLEKCYFCCKIIFDEKVWEKQERIIEGIKEKINLN